jgi:hypothetical protein
MAREKVAQRSPPKESVRQSWLCGGGSNIGAWADNPPPTKTGRDKLVGMLMPKTAMLLFAAGPALL